MIRSGSRAHPERRQRIAWKSAVKDRTSPTGGTPGVGGKGAGQRRKQQVPTVLQRRTERAFCFLPQYRDPCCQASPLLWRWACALLWRCGREPAAWEPAALESSQTTGKGETHDTRAHRYTHADAALFHFVVFYGDRLCVVYLLAIVLYIGFYTHIKHSHI